MLCCPIAIKYCKNTPTFPINLLHTPTFTRRLRTMAQEGSEASVASSSPTPNWWEMHANPVISWNAINLKHPHSNASSNCEDQDNSGISMDSSSADLSGEPSTTNHLWNQVLFSVGRGGGELHGSHDTGENILEGLPSKALATEMFNPACDYLKKLDCSWGFRNHPQELDALEKQMNAYHDSSNIVEPERMTNYLTDLVSNWSIAPPSPTMAQYPLSTLPQSQPYMMPHSYAHDMKGERVPLLRPLSSGIMEYQVDPNNSVTARMNKYCSEMAEAPWSSNANNLSDLISFGSGLSKPAMEFRATRSSDSKKYENSSSPKGSGRSSGSGEGKKKRSDESSETLLKKSKHEGSSISSLKLQAPKVKLGDRITALQQIVSPFGKTDTASVLMEAINYIRFLQEQVQLLSDPYIKSSTNKDHKPWGGLERKEKADPNLDLRSRGLCLVPISCTPQIYRENTGPDYWTPTYRGCLYR